MRRSVLILTTALCVAGAAAKLSPPKIGARRPRDESPSSQEKKLVAKSAAAALTFNSLVTVLKSYASKLRRHPVLMLAALVYVQHKRNRQAKGKEMDDIRCQVDLGKDFHLAIVTTAALPWLTGTAVNPLLRAAHLAKAGRRVTLMVPWLHPTEQQRIFPGSQTFATPSEQEAHMLEWLRTRGGLSTKFRLAWYPGRYDAERGSILPLGDITRFFSADESDVCVLEEPEHLTWYHSGPSWRHRFKLVVGVVHTNYVYYARTLAKGGGPILAATMQAINHHMCQAYCDKVIKLSDTLQPLPRACVCNVHGVRADFLSIGARLPRGGFTKGAYFIGKALWAKGHRHLINYLELARSRGDAIGRVHIDLFGKGEDVRKTGLEPTSSGLLVLVLAPCDLPWPVANAEVPPSPPSPARAPQLPAIRAEAEAKALDIAFLPPTDHAGATIRAYKVFVNPSQVPTFGKTLIEPQVPPPMCSPASHGKAQLIVIVVWMDSPRCSRRRQRRPLRWANLSCSSGTHRTPSSSSLRTRYRTTRPASSCSSSSTRSPRRPRRSLPRSVAYSRGKARPSDS